MIELILKFSERQSQEPNIKGMSKLALALRCDVSALCTLSSKLEVG